MFTKYSGRSIYVIHVTITRNVKAKIYAKLLSGSRPLDEITKPEITSLNADNFDMYKGKIKKNIMAAFAPYALQELNIAPAGTRPNTYYGILMDKAKIKIMF